MSICGVPDEERLVHRAGRHAGPVRQERPHPVRLRVADGGARETLEVVRDGPAVEHETRS